MPVLKYFLLPLVLVVSLVPAAAQTQSEGINSHLVVTTVRTEGIQVDGVLDEADWQRVEPATDFVNFRPTEGVPSSQKTEARVLYGKNAIFVGVTLHETDPSKIRRILTRRDDTDGADTFLAAFDSYNDRKTAYFFGVTAAGVQFDGLISGGGDDDSWDAVWHSAVRTTDEGWVVEMAIPYSQLRFSEGETTWGLEFKRDIRRTGEESFWAPLTSDQANSGLAQLFGRLEGLEGITPRRTLQITPYTVASANTFEDSADPGALDSHLSADAGVDFRVGLSSNVTLDATINPDFGQVEADPAQLNLSTFETFFQERRPFFLEGTQIFDYTFGGGDGALLYTRRIGGRSPIVGATKISGRMPSGLSFGVLGATTGEDFNPNRFYGSTRIKQEFGSQNYIGGAVTGFAYNDPKDGQPAVTAFAGGADWDVRVGDDGLFKFDGSLAGAVQTVDDPTNTDPTRRGYALYLGFDKVKGFLNPGSGLRIYSPDFEINDMGRFRETNLIKARLGAQMSWNRNEPFGPFIRVSSFGGIDQDWQYDDGTNRGASLRMSNDAQFRNFWELEVFGGVNDIGGFDVRETRGLGPIRNFTNGGLSVDLNSDDRKRFFVSPEIGFWFGEDGERTVSGEFRFSWNASDRIELSSSAEFESTNNAVRWSANESLVRTADGLFIGTSTTSPDQLGVDDLFQLSATVTEADALLADLPAYNGTLSIPGGTGYYVPVFGARDTRDFNWSTRANVIFTPKLSLQLYGQLFAARGRYSDFQLLANPDELRAFDYPKRADFAFESLQANVVLRWEYRPGSTLFVVWTQSRNMSEAERLLRDGGVLRRSPFDRTTGDQLGETFDVFPNNVFLVKLNYLFQR